MSNLARLVAEAQTKKPANVVTLEQAEKVNLGDIECSELIGPESQLGQFFADLLPQQGNFALWTKHNRKHYWTDSHDGLIALAEGKLLDVQDTYYATAAFGSEISEKTGLTARTQSNVATRRNVHADFDCGPEKQAKDPDGTYPDQPTAAVDIKRFEDATGIRFTYILSSGTGLHAYLALTEDIDEPQWVQLAKVFQKLAKQVGIKLDDSCTTDSARVLRAPGALHSNGKRVQIIQRREVFYEPNALGLQIVSLLDEKPLPEATTRKGTNAEDNQEHDDPPADFGLIKSNCAAVSFAVGNPERVLEPYWRGLLGIVKFCTGAEQLAHEVSKGYPGYDEQQTQDKYDNWNTPPTTCGEFAKHSKACESCPHKGKIKSPIMLGKEAPSASSAMREAVRSGQLDVAVNQNGDPVLAQSRALSGGRVSLDVMLMASESGRDVVTMTAYKAHGKPPSKGSIDFAITQTRYDCKESGKRRKTELRVASGTDGAIEHFLRPGFVARIDACGYSVVDQSGDDAPWFVVSGGAGDLPNPANVTCPKAALRIMFDWWMDVFGLSKPDALVMVVTLLEYLRPNTPKPLTELVAAAGAGKSMVGEVIQQLIDPTADGARAVVGAKLDNITATCQQRWIIFRDNVSKMDQETSDLHCVNVTGAVSMVRKLYSNGEIVAMALLRPVVITAVHPVVKAPDLMTRTNRFELKPREGEVVTEEVLRAKLTETRPQLMGALYCLLSAAMRHLPEVVDRGGFTHRMASFDQLGEAVSAAVGGKQGQFIRVVGAMRSKMNRKTASGDRFVLALLAVLKDLSAKPTSDVALSLNAINNLHEPLASWHGDDQTQVCGRPSALRRKLMSQPQGMDPRHGSVVPDTDRAMGEALRRVHPMLAGMGIKVEEKNLGSRAFVILAFTEAALGDV